MNQARKTAKALNNNRARKPTQEGFQAVTITLDLQALTQLDHCGTVYSLDPLRNGGFTRSSMIRDAIALLYDRCTAATRRDDLTQEGG